MRDLNDILFNRNEKIISVLGNNAIQKFLSTGTLGNGFAVLSDKRLYFRGKCLYKKGNSFEARQEEKAVDLKDVTGTGFEHINPVGLLIVGIISLVSAAICLFIH